MSLSKTLVAVGSTRAGLVPLRFPKPKHQPTTNPGSAPARAAQHSLRLLQETSLGKALGLATRRLSNPGAHALAADLATGGTRQLNPGRVEITHNPENQIRHVGAYRAVATTRECHVAHQNVFPLFN